MKKLIIGLLVATAFVCFVSISTLPAFAESEKLYIMNWYDYIDENLLDEFEVYYKEQTGKDLEVEYNKQDTNEIMITQASVANANIDLICPSEYAIQKLLTMDLIQPIGDEKEELWENVQPLFTTEINRTFSNLEINGTKVDLTDYFVPYMMGTLGILYNADIVTEADLNEGWGLLWNSANNPNLNKKIYMKDSIRDAYVAAVMRLKELERLPEGYEALTVQQLINNSDVALIDAAEKILKEQKSAVMGYSVDFDKDEMKAGRAYVDLAWSGDAVYIIEEAAENNVNLAYFVPEIGSNIWFDGWVLAKNSQNPTAAKMFMAFMNIPKNAIRNMLAIGYTSSVDPSVLQENDACLEILEENEINVEDFFANSVQYYDGSAELGVMKDFGNKESDLVNMWERVKNTGSLLVVYIIIGVIVVIVAVVAVVYVTNKNKKVRRKVN